MPVLSKEALGRATAGLISLDLDLQVAPCCMKASVSL